MSAVDYEEIFDKAEVGIALNDPEEGTVGVVNEHYAELMGYRRDELKEMKIGEVSADDPTFDQEAAMGQIQRALEGETQRFDWLFERKDGSQFWGEVVLKRTTIGDVDRLLAFVRDVSARKRYERALEQQNERLDEFASIVSHELVNPLTVATGRLELAREACDSEHLDAVEQAHERMEDLIEGVLSLARAGKSVVETQAVVLPELLEACWRTIGGEPATLEVDTEATVRAEESRLRQLLENLLRNAVVHGGDGVEVTVGSLDDGFFIEDDGQGIPEADRGEIFEAGFSTATDGTGFGLRIVKQVADAHGWDFGVTTSDDGGARFEFTGVHLE